MTRLIAHTAFAAFILLFLLRPLPAAAQTNGSVQPPEGRALQKGAIDLGVTGGGALPVDFASARPDRRLWFGAFEIGRIMTAEHGPAWLAGQFELLAQVTPIVVRGPDDFWGVGLSPLFVRWNFSGNGLIRPYFEASAGLMLIDWEAPGPGHVTRNFTEQVGIGVRLGQTFGRGALLGYRYQHISNGSGSMPSPGIDTHLVYVGLSSLK